MTDKPALLPRSSTETLIKALRLLARDIQSRDGIANACCAEAADRLDELHTPNPLLKEMAEALGGMIYETTHLSPMEDDGSHKCRITKCTLEKARAILAKYKQMEG